MAELLTYAVAAAGCLGLYLYFTAAVCIGAGAPNRVPWRIVALMYGESRRALTSPPRQAAEPGPTWRRPSVALSATLAVGTQLMSLALLVPDGDGRPAGVAVVVLVFVELCAAAAWTAVLLAGRAGRR